MRTATAALFSTAALALPIVNVTAAVAAPKKTVGVKKKTIAGAVVETGRWGPVQVSIVVRKTTTRVGTKVTVKRRVMTIKVPTYPNHTDRSIFINQQALPILEQEVLQAQFNPNIEMVSGATYTSNGFAESLQAALLKAKRV